VRVRDRDEFERMKATWQLPDEIAAQAEATCARIRKMVEQYAEPFGEVGKGWLTRFLAEVELPD